MAMEQRAKGIVNEPCMLQEKKEKIITWAHDVYFPTLPTCTPPQSYTNNLLNNAPHSSEVEGSWLGLICDAVKFVRLLLSGSTSY